MPAPAYPPIVTLPYTLFVAVLVPVYWVHYGPANFLWFSDIALFAVLIALWTGTRIVYSMMAIGVLPLEVAWTVDFLTGGQFIGLTGYMFDADSPLYLRGLSLFHLMLPPLIVWMLIRQGYEPRALPAQTALALVVLPVTWLLTPPEDNINWVHGLGAPGETVVPPLVYLGLLMAVLPVAVFLPMHHLLARLFPPRPDSSGGDGTSGGRRGAARGAGARRNAAAGVSTPFLFRFNMLSSVATCYAAAGRCQPIASRIDAAPAMPGPLRSGAFRLSRSSG